MTSKLNPPTSGNTPVDDTDDIKPEFLDDGPELDESPWADDGEVMGLIDGFMVPQKDHPNWGKNVEFRKKRKPGKAGPPRKYLPYADAAEAVHNEMIGSVTAYYTWWDLHKPSHVPKFPHSVYVKDFISWNHYLGNTNKFGNGRGIKKLSFEEAKAIVHKERIGSIIKWWEYCKSGCKPETIPSRPDLAYRTQWRGYNDWLGKTRTAIAQTIIENGATFFVVQNKGRPNNVYQLGITADPISTIKRASYEYGFRIISIHTCEIELDWLGYIADHGVAYKAAGRKDEYMVQNIYALLEDMSEFISINKL